MGNYKPRILVLAEENKQLKKKIEKLKSQLKNAIIPKFKVRQEVYYINIENKITSGIIYNIRYDSVKGFDYFIPMLQIEDFRIKEKQLFATKDEAEQHLKLLDKDKKDTI